MLRPFLVASTLASLLAGCAADDNTTSPDANLAFYPDGNVGTDTGTDAVTSTVDSSACDETSVSCADLAFPTSTVTYATSTGTLPLATGGAVAPGLYYLVSQTTYGAAGSAGGEAGAPGIQTSALDLDDCGHFTFTSFTSGGGSTSVAATVAGTYSAAGETLHLVEDCPSIEGLTPLLYTATATSLTFVEPADPLSGASAAVSVYAKQ